MHWTQGTVISFSLCYMFNTQLYLCYGKPRLRKFEFWISIIYLDVKKSGDFSNLYSFRIRYITPNNGEKFISFAHYNLGCDQTVSFTYYSYSSAKTMHLLTISTLELIICTKVAISKLAHPWNDTILFIDCNINFRCYNFQGRKTFKDTMNAFRSLKETRDNSFCVYSL